MFAGMNSPMPRAVRLLLFTALVALLVHVAHTVFGLGGAPSHTFVDDWLYTLVLAACALMCFARGAGPRGERAAWILIGTGIAAWTAGDAYWAFHLSHQEEIAYPSLADAARLMLFPAAYAGIALLVRARVPRFHASLWLDGAIGALAIAAVGAAIMYRAIERTTQGDVEAVAANVAYPLGDLLLVGFVIGAVALTGWRPGRGLVLIALGLSVNAIANGIYLYRDATGGALEHSPVDSLWLLSALLLALAAWIRAHSIPCAPARGPPAARDPFLLRGGGGGTPGLQPVRAGEPVCGRLRDRDARRGDRADGAAVLRPPHADGGQQARVAVGSRHRAR